MIDKAITACVLLLSLNGAAGQQQTGAPAGIAVPPVPPAPGAQASLTGPAQSAVFRVRVVDGRNGAAIRNAHVKLWYDEPAGIGYDLATNEHGTGNMPAPVGEPLRVLLRITGYTDCRKPMRGDPPQGYSMSAVASTGLAAQNTCGSVALHAHPGELILFARPGRWYEGLNRNVGN
ncbi:MAG: hypothetical protein ACRYGF_18595 [Janthinobacterium lividum]